MNRKDVFKINKVKFWLPEEDEILKREVESMEKKSWKIISLKLKKKSASDCFTRYRRISNRYLKGKWSRIEDNLLGSLVQKHGRHWSKISNEMKTRSGKQIRDRYLNMLDEKIDNSKFTINEDILILDLHEKFGNKWSFFTNFLKNRSPDKIKNRFNSSIKNKKKLLSFLKTLDSRVGLNFYYSPIFINYMKNFFYKNLCNN
jgi:myb proto-oncogene protein